MGTIHIYRRLLTLAFLVFVSVVAMADESRIEQLLREFDRTSAMTTANDFMKEMQQLGFFDDPIQFKPSDGRDTLRQQVWYWAAEWFYDHARYQQAADYARRALPLLHIPTEQADCQSLLSIIHVRLGDYMQAAEYAKQVYQIDQASGDIDRQSSSLNTLAGIYLYANQPKEAEKYTLRGIKLARETGNTARLAVLLGKASEIYHAEGNDEEALRYAEEAYQLDKKDGREEKAALRLAQKASVLNGLKRYDEAAKVLGEVIPVFRQSGDRQSLGIACNKMGQALLGQERNDDAATYFREAVQIFAAIGDLANELHAHKGLYEALWKSNPDEAKREIDRFNGLRDSIYNNVSAESLARYNAEFGNDWLQLENHEQRRAKFVAIIVGIVAALVLALIAVFIWWVMHRRHQRQQAINQQLTTDINELREKYDHLQIHYDHAINSTAHHEEAEELNNTDQEFLEKVMNAVNELIHQGSVDANSVAESLGLSLFQLRQRLGDITGETPQSLIQMVRMRRARHLLDNHPELNITEIAQLCAYQDAPNFTRAFKKVLGITPTQYLERRQAQ